MFQKLKAILGIPPQPAEAKTVGPQIPTVRGDLPMYIPESQLPEGDGEVFTPWRVDVRGKLWYKRLSNDRPDSTTATHAIRAIADDGWSDPLSPDDPAELFPKFLDSDGVEKINVDLCRRNAAARILARDFAKREEILEGCDDDDE
ncbi:MAG: hypothetical protein KF752_03160 [Pirellulaceae bacterium]|nr:hypothetical protein [Pirellulaceae bacterium]